MVSCSRILLAGLILNPCSSDGTCHDREPTDQRFPAQFHQRRDRGGRGCLVVRVPVPHDDAPRPAVGAGAVERLITLNVNGQDRRVDVMPQETLAMTLRYKLGLTGTKLGCDRAECGACTVLVDDVPHYSCSVLDAHARAARRSSTIEGLADPATGKLSAVQQGVVDEQGFQCAFCMPGFVMAATGYLKTNPNPTRAGAGARRLRQSVPLPGLRQDSHRADARRRAHEEGVTWLTTN